MGHHKEEIEMPAITAKVLQSAAASVAGARSMGIETAASKAAPALLVAARAWLDKNEPCGPWASRASAWLAVKSAAADLAKALA